MKIFVMIPTYNEKENISIVIQKIQELSIKNLEILVVDDSSPDGTAKIVQELGEKDHSVHLLLRAKNRGRGFAGRAGYIYCLNHEADIVIEMDGDLSHSPKYIPEFLEWIKKYDVVLGSRMVEGGKDIGRGVIRKLITKLANTYITLLLGINVRDCNSGFRCFTKDILGKIKPETLRSKGPSIVQEVLFRAHLRKAKIKEVPIKFVNRTRGKSKLGLRELAMGYFVVLKLKMQHVLGVIR